MKARQGLALLLLMMLGAVVYLTFQRRTSDGPGGAIDGASIVSTEGVGDVLIIPERAGSRSEAPPPETAAGPRSVEVQVLVGDGSSARAAPDGSELHFLSVDDPSVRAAATVAGGRVALGRVRDDEPLFIDRLEIGNKVLAPMEGAYIPGGRNVHRVVLAATESWPVRFFDASTGGGLAGEPEVLLDQVTTWTGISPLLPPDSAERLRDVATQGQVDLPPPPGDVVYWIRFEGYPWFQYRWSRRFHLGQVVGLERPATVLLDCDERAPGRVLLVRTTSRLTHGEVLLETPMEDGVRAELPAGTFLFEVREPGFQWPVWCARLRLHPGQVLHQSVRCSRAGSTLVAVGSTGNLSGYRLFRLDTLGLGGPGYEVVDRNPESTARGLRWTDIPVGEYALRCPQGCLHVTRVEDHEDAHVSLDACSAPFPRDIHIVEAGSGRPLELSYARWSLVVEGGELVRGMMLPETGIAGDLAGLLRAPLPPGELQVLCRSEIGTEYASVEIVDGKEAHVLELHGIWQLNVGLAEEDRGHFPPAWLADFAFRRDGVLIDEQDVSFGFLVGETRLRKARLLIAGGPPDEVYVPPTDQTRPASGWLDVPPTGSPVDHLLGRGWELADRR